MERYVDTMSAATVELARALDDQPSGSEPVEFRPPLGTVQRRIVALDDIDRPEGMRLEDIAAQANRPGGPSTVVVLDTLRRRGILEQVSNGSSPRYRLAPRYRRAAEMDAAAPRRRALVGG